MKKITFADVRPRYDALGILGNVIYDGRFIGGMRVSEFEELWADYCGTSMCVAVGNGFDALYMTLRAYGIGKGDEVIVPSNTCIPTWAAVMHTGATVMPVEPDVDTYNIEFPNIVKSMTKRTRAVVPVHMYGQIVDDTVGLRRAMMNPDILVIEDAAHAHGGVWGVQSKAGSLGDAAAFSFYPTKNLGALGDAGAVTTNDKGLAIELSCMRDYGGEGWAGVNSRMDSLQASFLAERLRTLDAENEKRRNFAHIYLETLAGLDYIKLPVVPISIEPVWHQFVVRCKTAQDRLDLRWYLHQKGVETMIHYDIVPADELRTGHDTPIARHLSETIISLPIAPHLTKSDIEYVCEHIIAYGDDRREE